MYIFIAIFYNVNFNMKMNREMMLGSRSARGDRNEWSLACTLLVGTKGNCGWICSWPCEPCAYLPEVVHARSGSALWEALAA